MRCKWIYKQHISLFYTNISSDSLIVVITLSQFFLSNGTATASIVLFIEKNQGIHPMQVLRGHRTIRRKRRRPSMIQLLRIVPQRQLVETTVQFTIVVTMQIRMVSVVIRPNSTASSSTSILSFVLEPTMECPRCTRIVGAPTVNADSNHKQVRIRLPPQRIQLYHRLLIQLLDKVLPQHCCRMDVVNKLSICI
jgi:hypothetical protein